MGLFNKLFSGRREYPELDVGSPTARRLEEVREPLEGLAGEVSDRLEVVPAERRAYVFIGKPPKQFGLAWVEDGRVENLKNLIADRGLSQKAVGSMIQRLQTAYQEHREEPRYSATLAGRRVVVTPSNRLGTQVQQIIQQAKTP